MICMAQPKYTLYKYVKLARGKWRYCRAAHYKNHMIKPNSVMVGEKEEVHSEGDYYIAHGDQWTNVGPDALEAQRQQHRLLAGGVTVRVREPDTGKYNLVTIPSAQPQEPVANGRKKIKDEISKLLPGSARTSQYSNATQITFISEHKHSGFGRKCQIHDL